MHTVYVKDVLFSEHPEVIVETGNFNGRVFCLQRVGSCLDSAWSLFNEQRLRPWDSVLCARQTAGRGRMRRSWESPPGNIYAALLLPALDEKWSKIVSHVAGYVLCKALRDIGVDIRVKWPNDLWTPEGKVGGILVEEKSGVFMLGAGINLHSCPSNELMRADGIARSDKLGGCIPNWTVPGLWAYLVYWARNWYGDKDAAYLPQKFVAEYEKIMAFRGLFASLETADGPVSGLIQGISTSGELLLRTRAGLQALHSGSFGQIEK
ncbi:MAG: biotin--[acetyl-CoA-carboxylase] ligase [Thermodesulfobacteriota bacterium]